MRELRECTCLHTIALVYPTRRKTSPFRGRETLPPLKKVKYFNMGVSTIWKGMQRMNTLSEG